LCQRLQPVSANSEPAGQAEPAAAESPAAAVEPTVAFAEPVETAAADEAEADKAPPAAPSAPVVNLDEVVKGAGLQLVETAPGAQAATPTPIPATPRPGRVRRKAPVAPPAPLQQVETDGPPPSP